MNYIAQVTIFFQPVGTFEMLIQPDRWGHKMATAGDKTSNKTVSPGYFQTCSKELGVVVAVVANPVLLKISTTNQISSGHSEVFQGKHPT